VVQGQSADLKGYMDVAEGLVQGYAGVPGGVHGRQVVQGHTSDLEGYMDVAEGNRDKVGSQVHGDHKG
jgi:hypothetical protein